MPTLTLPYPPSANRLWRHFRGRVVKSDEARAYQHMAGMEALRSGVVMSESPVRAVLVVHPKKPKRYKAGDRPRCIDRSNAIKVVEDALNGIAWIDDSLIDDIRVMRGHPIDGGALIIRWELIEDFEA